LIRLSNNYGGKLQETLTTQIIKYHLEQYFEADYRESDKAFWKEKVLVDEVALCLEKGPLVEMYRKGIKTEAVLKQLVVDFMKLLDDEEELTPNLLTEYFLAKMIERAQRKNIPTPVFLSTEQQKEMQDMLVNYYEELFDEMNDLMLEESVDDFETLMPKSKESIQDRIDYVQDMSQNTYDMITDFRCFFGVDELGIPEAVPSDECSVFWDHDYMLIEEVGINMGMKIDEESMLEKLLGLDTDGKMEPPYDLDED